MKSEILNHIYSEGLYGVLDWQRVGSRRMVQHYLNVDMVLQVRAILIPRIFFRNFHYTGCEMKN